MEENYSSLEKKTQVLTALAGGLIASAVGSSVALPSSLIPQVIEEELVEDFDTGSWIATSYLYAAIPASLFGGIINDFTGRRLTALFCCLPLLVGNIMMSLSPSMAWLLTGRVITSISVWLCYPSATVLISECVHPSVRGYLGVFPSIFLAGGMFKSYLLGYLLHWRTICWVLCLQPVIMCVVVACIKESPYWLVQKGRKEEARNSLQWYRGEKYDITEEFDEIVKKKEEESKTKKGNLCEKIQSVFSLTFLKCFCCSGILFFLCQFTGITSLVVFMTNVFEASGLTFDPKLAPIIIGGVRVTTACFSSAALRTGNRLYMYCSCSIILCICCFLLASFSHWREDFLSTHSVFGFLPLVITITMFIAHAFGINSVLHLLTAEIFPTSVRSMGSSCTLCFAMVGNAINSTFYPVIQKHAGFSGCFWFYSACSLAMAVYAYIVIPDNRGLSLVKIERNREGGNKLLEQSSK